MTVLGCLLIAGIAATASDQATDPNARHDEVVALVLAQDARYAGLTDFRRQQIQQQSQGSFDPIIGSGYDRVLPTVTTRWSDAVGIDLFAFREARNFRRMRSWRCEGGPRPLCQCPAGRGLKSLPDTAARRAVAR